MNSEYKLDFAKKFGIKIINQATFLPFFLPFLIPRQVRFFCFLCFVAGIFGQNSSIIKTEWVETFHNVCCILRSIRSLNSVAMQHSTCKQKRIIVCRIIVTSRICILARHLLLELTVMVQLGKQKFLVRLSVRHPSAESYCLRNAHGIKIACIVDKFTTKFHLRQLNITFLT